jgi:hypothetical protein
LQDFKALPYAVDESNVAAGCIALPTMKAEIQRQDVFHGFCRI